MKPLNKDTIDIKSRGRPFADFFLHCRSNNWSLPVRSSESSSKRYQEANASQSSAVESDAALERLGRLAKNITSGCYWLGSSNPKTLKGLKEGYITATLSLAPADYSNYTTCFNYSKCRDTCLYNRGRGRMPKIAQIRIRKTNEFFDNLEDSLFELSCEIRRINKRVLKTDMKLAVRPNTFSDIKWEELRPKSLGGLNIFEANPEVQFYDYTKIPLGYREAWTDMPINYHLTYSWDGTDKCADYAQTVLDNGHNVAVVLTKAHHAAFMANLEITGGDLLGIHQYTLKNNEDSDNRFLDPSPVILLGREKGKSNIAQ